MATFLFDKIVFGPVNSRRLGVSLGINLLPADSKICSFDCIYCECGRNPREKTKLSKLPARKEVKEKLAEALREMQQGKPDVITFAGNGEPTIHPDFAGIIDDTIGLRNQYAPLARIAVLSNATMLHRKEVVDALLKTDDNIQKLDSAFEETIQILNCPGPDFNLHRVVDQLAAFQGKVTIQTMFVKGIFRGIIIDNTVIREVEAWIGLLKKINPLLVMIYTISRDTPVGTLQKVAVGELHKIARKVESEGFRIQVTG